MLKAHRRSVVLVVVLIQLHLDVRLFSVCVFVCADDCSGGASVWSPAAGALWRSGGESGNTPAQKWSTEFKNHPS